MQRRDWSNQISFFANSPGSFAASLSAWKRGAIFAKAASFVTPFAAPNRFGASATTACPFSVRISAR